LFSRRKPAHAGANETTRSLGSNVSGLNMASSSAELKRERLVASGDCYNLEFDPELLIRVEQGLYLLAQMM
jgi:hypothetical protein